MALTTMPASRAAGAGQSERLMPMVAAEVASGQLACLPGIELDLRVRFGCAWLKARTLSPVAARFMELLAAHDHSLAPATASPA